MFTVESLKKEIADVEFPKNWREGQKVFNYVDQVFGIARYIQFNKGIDCKSPSLLIIRECIRCRISFIVLAFFKGLTPPPPK